MLGGLSGQFFLRKRLTSGAYSTKPFLDSWCSFAEKNACETKETYMLTNHFFPGIHPGPSKSWFSCWFNKSEDTIHDLTTKIYVQYLEDIWWYMYYVLWHNVLILLWLYPCGTTWLESCGSWARVVCSDNCTCSWCYQKVLETLPYWPHLVQLVVRIAI